MDLTGIQVFYQDGYTSVEVRPVLTQQIIQVHLVTEGADNPKYKLDWLHAIIKLGEIPSKISQDIQELFDVADVKKIFSVERDIVTADITYQIKYRFYSLKLILAETDIQRQFQSTPVYKLASFLRIARINVEPKYLEDIFLVEYLNAKKYRLIDEI